ncbi:MAG TPA: hypothetical protein VK607_27255 [Kofleriaceae bacterium]|nr:hypothetical protein [Kofleriaceae bacterium]
MSPPSTSTKVQIDEDSYVPQVEVQVNHAKLDPAILNDITELRVTLQKDEPSGFSMTLANHFTILEQLDARNKAQRKYRYSDDTIFDALDLVAVKLGYVGRMQTLFVGEIQTIQPSFPSGDFPTMTVTGIDALNQLRLDKPNKNTTKSFPNVADHEIVRRVAARHKLQMTKDSDTKGSPSKKPAVQRDMDDLQFVLFLAKRNNFECSIVLEDNQPKLYFGVPRDQRDGTAIEKLTLTWGESLISFTPTLRVGRQVSKVTVRSWNTRTKEPIEYTAELKDIKKTGGHGKTGPEIIAEKYGAKEYRIVDRPVQSLDEAKTLAKQILTENANQYLTGSGEAMGEPLLRPQVNLHIDGIGQRFDGDYYVTKTEHRFGGSGYTTSFDVERMTDGGTPS